MYFSIFLLHFPPVFGTTGCFHFALAPANYFASPKGRIVLWASRPGKVCGLGRHLDSLFLDQVVQLLCNLTLSLPLEVDCPTVQARLESVCSSSDPNSATFAGCDLRQVTCLCARYLLNGDCDSSTHLQRIVEKVRQVNTSNMFGIAHGTYN